MLKVMYRLEEYTHVQQGGKFFSTAKRSFFKLLGYTVLAGIILGLTVTVQYIHLIILQHLAVIIINMLHCARSMTIVLL